MKPQDLQMVTTRGDEISHENPAIGSFLELLENDISSGKHLGNLPYDLVQAMFAALAQPVDPAIGIEGDVALWFCVK
jgi:antitoxin PrlF